MGLLQPEERDVLKDLLVLIPNRGNSAARDQLLVGQLPQVRNNVGRQNAPAPDIAGIVDGVDDQDTDRPTGAQWPVLILIRQALTNTVTGPNWPYRPDLIGLQTTLQARAAQRDSLPVTTPPLDEANFEQVIGQVGFINLDRVIQARRAVCRIEFAGGFKGNIAQGSGFLLGESLVLTNYHVMEPVFDEIVGSDKVVLRFDYMGPNDTGSNATDTPGYECRLNLAAQWRRVDSHKDDLDYALLQVTGAPGTAAARVNAGSAAPYWLTPEEHTFLGGEHLFIVRHPRGNPQRFAMDLVKEVREDLRRVMYATDTEGGSSGSPCFAIKSQQTASGLAPTIELVALHQGTFGSQANRGIPFNYILPEIASHLSGS